MTFDALPRNLVCPAVPVTHATEDQRWKEEDSG